MTRHRRITKPASPLSSTELTITITDLVAEYLVCHRFENTGKKAIEAVFSFPVPLDAAFLGMQATLAGETVVAEILPKHQASQTYDDAIAEGNSAVLLNAPEPGVLCTSLGNLLPGETGEVMLRFVTALRVADNTARFSLPLVHRPRYGSWSLDELETPTNDFAIEHPMSATILINGLLASAPVSCATHAARFARRGEGSELSISQAMLDRDLVLVFELSDDLPATSHLIADGDANLGLVGFVLPASTGTPNALDLCLVLDGSGSMAGDAIEQSRQALSSVIDALGDEDRIQVLRFGSTVVPLFRRPLLATARVRDALRELVPTIDATLGGTAMDDALEQAMANLGQTAEGRSRAIILVTDGAVQSHDIAAAQANAIAAGVRLFVVAVGSSAAAEVLEPMAAATNAVLERAVPAEPIEACVMRQFRRARELNTVAVTIDWPSQQAQPIPFGMAYSGDAVQLAARLPEGIEGDVIIRAPSLGFSLKLRVAGVEEAPGLRALLGQRRHRLADDEAKEALALQYGLLTDETSAVLVKQRTEAEKAEGLPLIVKVPGMVPDGMVFDTGRMYCASVSDSSWSSFESHSMKITSACRESVGVRGSVSMDSSEDRAREILEETYLCLAKGLLPYRNNNFRRFSYGSLMGSIQERRLIGRLWDLISRELSTDRLFDENLRDAWLLLALHEALGYPPLTDEQNAILATIFARAGLDADPLAPEDARQSRVTNEISRMLESGFEYST